MAPRAGKKQSAAQAQLFDILKGKEKAMTQATAVGTVSEERINRFLAQVYLVMTLGLVVTGVVSMWAADNLRLQWRLATNPWIAFGLFIVQIIVVVALSAAAMRLSTGAAVLLFLLYAALTGLTLSTIFLVYAQEDISSVFWITAGTFFLTSLVGLLLKRDLSGGGTVLLMLLLGWVVAWTFSIIFFPDSNVNWVLNFVGIAIFVGLTAHDTQRLKQIGQQVDNHPARGGLAVVGALTLYLDFINLFLLLLRARSR
jgi:FtsH-binding integral membrane protein